MATTSGATTALIHELIRKIDELTATVNRIELLVLGDGVSGLANRVSCLEGTVERGERSLAARIATIEQRMDTINRLTWLVISTLIITILTALLQLVVR